MKKVLIVDDAGFARMFLKKTLEENGFDVIGEADNGVQGVKMFMELHPDVVTMDVTMPDMDGLEALKLIRSIDPYSKIIMISAIGQENLVRQSVMLGAKSFIVKPFRNANVIKTLKQVLNM